MATGGIDRCPGLAFGAALLAGCTGDGSDAVPTTTRPRATTTGTTRPELTGPPPVATAVDVVVDLGCTELQPARVSLPHLAQALDCLREGEFVARVHAFAEETSAEDVERMTAQRLLVRAPVEPEGHAGEWCSPGVVVGDRWVLLTSTEDEARPVAQATGGQIAPVVDHGPVVSYLNPPCPAGEP